MANVKELEQFVKDNPQDHEKRWRLAKKLYMASEYKLAMRHLQVLKRDWEPKQNVMRYLSATYYRMGRYEEAIAKLEDAIEEWPEEVGLREQLARVYEVADRRDDAARVWEAIEQACPDHPLASRAANRLRKKSGLSAEDDLGLHDSDSGIDLSPVMVCPNCSAQNSVEFERCWQCHALLSVDETTPVPMAFEEPVEKTPSPIWPFAKGFGFVATIAMGVYLTLAYVAPEMQSSEPVARMTVHQTILRGLAVPRAIMLLALLVAWPAFLYVSLKVFRVKEMPHGQPWGLAIFLSAFAYLLSWTPIAVLPAIVAVVIITAAILTPLVFAMGWPRGIGAGLIHGLLACAVGCSVFLGVAGLEPITEASAINAYRQQHDKGPEPGVYETHRGNAPFTIIHQFDKTGSPWLDQAGGVVDYEISSRVMRPPLAIRFYNETGDLINLKEMTSDTVRLRAHVDPAKTYRIVVDHASKEGMPISIQPRGLLTIRVQADLDS
jgi:hypothetical protein